MSTSGSGLTNLRLIRALVRKATDAWGYTFVLGSARAWFERDAEDARALLFKQGLIDAGNAPSGQLRTRS